MMVPTLPVSGIAAGVPFVVVPPRTPRPSAPVVVAWHLLDPPDTEAAMAAALPLEGLDAWRVYLGLPLCGARVPAGGQEELMRRAAEDVVVRLQGPMIIDAAAEFPTVLDALATRFGFGEGPLGLLGGSLGSAVAGLVLTEGASGITERVAAAVLVSPIAQLRASVDSTARLYGFPYTWTPPAEQYARRLDLVARAGELAGTDVLLLVGADDDPEGYRAPAAALAAELAARRAGSAVLELVPGMAHALADESAGPHTAQIPAAAHVDRRAVAWFAQRLTG